VGDAALASGAPPDQFTELGRVLDLLAGFAGSAFAGNRYGCHAEVFQLLVGGGLAVAAVGGHLTGDPAESVVDTFDRGHELLGVGRMTGLDVVVEDQPIFVVDDLGLGPELDRLTQPAFDDRPRVGVVQADQPGGRVHHLPGDPPTGLGHHPDSAGSEGGQLVDRLVQPAAAPPGVSGRKHCSVDSPTLGPCSMSHRS
jgi:hypothetical protein